MTWHVETIEEALAKVWGEDDEDRGVEHCLSYISRHLIYGGSILDFGCGVGRLTKPLAKAEPETRFVGVDISWSMIDLAWQRAGHNEWYQTTLHGLTDIRSAFSVVTFQHMPDVEVAEVIAAIYPARFRFQFAVGEIHEPDNHQRPAETVQRWCWDAGYTRATVGPDHRFPTWRWITAQ